MSASTTSTKARLTAADYARAAANLGVPVAAVHAVDEVEAPRGGFLDTGEPTILFERHLFSRYTGGKYDKTAPDISNPIPGGYGPSGAQHGRLARAAALDRAAALKATSWGKYQILGVNFVQAGFDSLQKFVTAMYRSEGAQLDAFVNYVQHDAHLWQELKQRDWANFARRYNGPNYAINDYDTKLATAFAAHAREGIA